MTYQEKIAFYEKEREGQRLLDLYYISRKHEVDRSGSCKDFDCILDRTEKVEEKIRSKERKDLLIEVIQDMSTYSPGWFYETKCDYLHYVFMNDTGTKITSFYRFDWPKLKGWFIGKYLKTKHFPESIVSTKGWGITLNISVPIDQIPSYMYFQDRPKEAD